jgi:2-polyprenyl-6-methoxyphenol hydroxylase-like FAD-dependent oxidoreductase
MPDDIAGALQSYEAERLARTAQAQLAARNQADFLHAGWPAAKHPDGHDASLLNRQRPSRYETDWLYAYDPTYQGR